MPFQSAVWGDGWLQVSFLSSQPFSLVSNPLRALCEAIVGIPASEAMKGMCCGNLCHAQGGKSLSSECLSLLARNRGQIRTSSPGSPRNLEKKHRPISQTKEVGKGVCKIRTKLARERTPSKCSWTLPCTGQTLRNLTGSVGDPIDAIAFKYGQLCYAKLKSKEFGSGFVQEKATAQQQSLHVARVSNRPFLSIFRKLEQQFRPKQVQQHLLFFTVDRKPSVVKDNRNLALC